MSATAVPDSLLAAVSVLDTLVRAGLRHLVVSPGSRNAPLTYALAALDRAGIITAHVRIDERSAGFTALGLAKGSQEPVALITTSGTAVGNLLPAVMEASHSGVPLLIISADRPEHLRGSGANQTTRQPGIFSSFTRAEADLTNYHEGRPEDIAALARCVDAAWGRSPENWQVASREPLGPVHINLALDLPLTPEPEAAQLLDRWAQSLTDLSEPAPLPAPDRTAASWLASDSLPELSRRAVVVAGDLAGPIAQQFAQKLGLPLLAEPSSQARFSPLAIEAYTEVLSGELGQQIEAVAVFGHPTLSRPIAQLLARQDIPVYAYEPQPVPWHEAGKGPGEPVQTLAQLADALGQGHGQQDEAGQGWLDSWVSRGQAARARAVQDITDYLAGGSAQGRTVGRALALEAWQRAVEEGEVLVVGSSNLIRDLDFIAPSLPVSPRVYANRGLAGIDGTTATATGISLATYSTLGRAQAVRLICGDLTFLHDAGSLTLGAEEPQPHLSIDVLDDCGGGIFATLEHGRLGQSPEFSATVQRFFTTAHPVDLEALASAYRQQGISVQVHRL